MRLRRRAGALAEAALVDEPVGRPGADITHRIGLCMLAAAALLIAVGLAGNPTSSGAAGSSSGGHAFAAQYKQ